MSSAAIVLAAGESRRLGQPKQLLELRGRPLVRHASEQARAAGCAPIIIVTGAFADQVEAVLDRTIVDVVRNDQWMSGQGGSVAVGVRHLRRRHPASNAVLLLVCDQPLIEVEHLRTLMAAVGGPARDIAATRYPDGAGGVPACFGRSCFERLSALDGDQGARSLLVMSDLSAALFDAACTTRDIDTPRDLTRLGNP